MGFCINDKGDAIDPSNERIILPQVINSQLNRLLCHQRVNLSDNYCKWLVQVQCIGYVSFNFLGIKTLFL